MNSKSLLIIDDEKRLCDLLARILELEGYTVHKAYTGKDGLAILEQQAVCVVLCDVKLPDYNGIDLVALIKQLKPHVQVINLTAYGTIADSVVAMRNGAYDYITKGDDNDKIIPLVAKAFEAAEIASKLPLNKKLPKLGFDNVVGKSKAILDLVAMAKKVANTEANVLLLGETGTGKEVFAKAIHQSSAHANSEFMAINCSAISAELLESELFGYKKGAFTGALQDKKGLLEQADGGTLFLDEIGDMPLHMQAKILRVLEDGTFIKLGDLQSRKVAIRIIAATNKNLLDEVEKGNFREDLYYRLSVFTLVLPRLNDRNEDIILLADHFIKQFDSSVPMNETFKAALLNHRWRGNIRELKNTIERSLILNDQPQLNIELLPANFNTEASISKDSLEMSSVEEKHIRKVLQHTAGNKSETARLLGIGLATLYRKMEQYGIAKY
ncbi:sigma-54-dependent transcriptional regulator [Pedobacter sp.]